MLLLQPPGVYAPQRDTELLADAFREETLPRGAHVLDIGTGTGVLALLAARSGGTVTAVDISPLAVLTARANARLHGRRIQVRRGDLFDPVATGRFQLVLANPPYVPARTDDDRRWDAGADGRAVIDRLCAAIPDRLDTGGVLLMVHSEMCGVATTLRSLRDAGLSIDIVRRCRVPFGPVLAGRAAWLRRRGVVGPGERDEQLVVIRAQR
ncbi:MAG: methyltransferase [Streptosporangiales bacterium]|nr:methyltransferase [Streptosporangiales bacterium]